MIVSTGLTVPVAVTARMMAPRVTAVVVYWTVPPALESHQTTPTAASAASDNRLPTSQDFRKREATDGAGCGVGTSAIGAGVSVRTGLISTGLFMRGLCFAPRGNSYRKRRSEPLIRVKILGNRKNRAGARREAIYRF